MNKPKTYAEAVAYLEKRRTELRIRGHKLIRSRSGCENTYQRGDCECGEWRFTGWTESLRSVRASHDNHLWSVYVKPFKDADKARAEARHDPRPWDGVTLV